MHAIANSTVASERTTLVPRQTWFTSSEARKVWSGMAGLTRPVVQVTGRLDPPNRTLGWPSMPNNGQLESWETPFLEFLNDGGEGDLVYVDGEGHTLRWLIGHLWNCSDRLPDDYCLQTELPSGSTFAAAARKFHRYEKGDQV